MEPIAIVGFAFKLPQDAVDAPLLWDVLENRRNLMTEWPENRGTIESFYDGGSQKPNTLHGRGAHFLKEDPAVFDAPFFSITSKEAAAMDPQQRWVLETAYHAFENAGIPMERLQGSRTAVFGASMSDDYSRMLAKDPNTAPRMAATGIEPSCLSNRVSWYFNLRGPSILVNTACSGSLIALDHACQSIRNGDASAALVFGSSMLLTPENSVLLSNMNFLSPDSLCYSFDSRANGYARGEGIVAVVVKSLTDALNDGDVIRGLIRATGSNQDGRTPGLTQPSAEAQEMLIRHVYQKAGLSFQDTRYVEAHGTGTPTGDPIEMKALGRVFRTCRSHQDPLYVGSIKSNIGHLEGASGLAGLLKAILVTEKGTIPPNALFERMNPAIDGDFYHVEVPKRNLAWPTAGLRRASVNSFGFGGSNAHVILDDALHYLQDCGLVGYHNCSVLPSHLCCPEVNGSTHSTEGADKSGEKYSSTGPRLLVWTGADANAIDRVINAYQTYYREQIYGDMHKLDQLAYTLAERRSRMLWRSFAVVDPAFETIMGSSNDQLPLLQTAKPVRVASEKLGIGFVFTGQGAQYVGMGLELLRYPVFAETMRRADLVLANLRCAWSLFKALKDQELLDKPEYSQPLCTVLQLALVEFLKSVGIIPRVVVGHSSGEIAAAYTIGALSFESACKVAYYRGQVAATLRLDSCMAPGSMMSVNLSQAEVPIYIEKTVGLRPDSVNLACVNSPVNCTLSGAEDVIDKVKQRLDADGIFAQKLKTGVAYHSPAMHNVATEYSNLLGLLNAGHLQSGISMVSSVTGRMVVDLAHLADAQYWVDNLVSPVQFADAVGALAKGSALKMGIETITDIIEIGPHPALRRPILDTLAAMESKMRYHAVLERAKSPPNTVLTLIGTLFCRGHTVSIAAGNGHTADTSPPPLVDCPYYPFDHSRKYWAESRMSKAYRLCQHSPGYLLGRRAHDWNTLRPSFRNWLSVEAIPWLGDHTISDNIICPGAGMVVMAIEAVRQSQPAASTHLPISGFFFKEIYFLNPIPVAEDVQAATETYLCVRPTGRPHENESTQSEISIFAYRDSRWTECFRAHVELLYDDIAEPQVDNGREKKLEDERVLNFYTQATRLCTTAIESSAYYKFLQEHGLAYGPAFRLLQDMHWNGQNISVARINEPSSFAQVGDCPVHPAVLDAAVHLVLAQVSRGMSAPMSTFVPQRLCNVWISARQWFSTEGSVRLTSILKKESNFGVEGSMYALANNGSPLCAIERMVMVPVSRNTNEFDVNNGRVSKLLYDIEWRPQLSGLNCHELQQLCDAQDERAATPNVARAIMKLESIMRQVACHVVNSLPRTDAASVNLPSHLRRFATSLKRYSDEGICSNLGELLTYLEEYEATNPAHRLLTIISRSLESILCGKVDTLELLIASNAAEVFYADIFDSLCGLGFRTFLDLASHQNPGLRIIEVGAGTGGMTRNVLGALETFENRTGSARFAEYVYTDVSPIFFDSARDKFAKFADRLVFKTLDLERNPHDEGFELGSYDMVIAGSVLHTTSHLATTMAHVRSLLRPGGYLVNIEITNPDCAWANIGFGSLPGWWYSTETWRQHGPLATVKDWQMLTHDAGFLNLDVDLLHIGDVSMMIARAIKKEQNHILQGAKLVLPHCRRLFLLVDPGQCDQLDLAAQLGKQWNNVETIYVSCTRDSPWTETDVVISLLEVGTPRLAKLSEHDFQTLQILLRRTQNMLWVTAPQIGHVGDKVTGPHYSIATGLLRVIRSEEPTKHIVTLALESFGAHDSDTGVTSATYESYITQVINTCYIGHSPEVEFAVQDGYLNIGRLVYAPELEEDRRVRIQPQLRDEPWVPGPALKLEVGTPGMLDTLRFIEDTQHDHGEGNAEEALKPQEVEIEAKAWPISFRDVFIAMGRLGQEELGFECAGIVRRTGPGAQFRRGDRVCMFIPGCMRMYPRAPDIAVFKVPDSTSFHDAVAAINPGMTAYHALVNIARLQKGEKILIHSAAGSTGQMALWIAKRVGAEIFATVGFEKKKQLLINTFGIPDDHIFYSRNTSFARGIMRMTNGSGVDVILNSLSGDKLQASWECIAPYGRFIEIGKTDIGKNTALPMAHFAQNVSFCAIDLLHIVQTNARLTRELVQAVMDMIANGEAACPTPLHVYPVTQVEKAFRFMQGGKNTGRIIIDISHDYMVPKLIVKRSAWRFNENASYIIAGGLGGLGRPIIRWMVKRGARNLIIPSRSGISNQSASQMVSELQRGGVKIIAKQCNVGSATELEALLKDCVGAGLPPIKGCINAAMSLHDAVFEGMTHTQWDHTIRSKVDSSWNLHQQLPSDMDFFILLSSLSGIYGSLAQGNYAAGCTFQDALARYRTALGIGKISVSFDLGWVRNAGIVAEREDYRRNRANARDMNPVDVEDIIALLDVYCDPDAALSEGRRRKSQLLVGAVTPVDTHNSGIQPASFESMPLFAGFAVAATTAKTARKQIRDEEHPAVLFRQASGDFARAAVVVTSLVDRLARALGISADDIDERRSLSDYGVDSLMAVELRNWIRRDFGAAVAVFEITGTGTSIKEVGALVAQRAEKC
ncbi:hypothetical protein M434DRAFT_401803 [Hypoxylon sp. CO27-5]|nr:hypothetical protein M434DRAFT_401803 [Hypoxylon sp. CO27-5]